MRFFIFVSFFFLFSFSAFAQKPYRPQRKLTPELMVEFEGEKPLTQKDINAFLKFYPMLPERKGSIVLPVGYFKPYGLSDQRGMYIVSKVPMTFQAINLTAQQRRQVFSMVQGGKELIPSEEEVNLIRDNYEALEILLHTPPPPSSRRENAYPALPTFPDLPDF